jgi:hypothetical protein
MFLTTWYDKKSTVDSYASLYSKSIMYGISSGIVVYRLHDRHLGHFGLSQILQPTTHVILNALWIVCLCIEPMLFLGALVIMPDKFTDDEESASITPRNSSCSNQQSSTETKTTLSTTNAAYAKSHSSSTSHCYSNSALSRKSEESSTLSSVKEQTAPATDATQTNSNQLHYLKCPPLLPRAAGAEVALQTLSPPQRNLELLVHNVSHTDMVLSLEGPGQNSTFDPDKNILCRPRFSCFDKYSKLVLHHLSGNEPILQCPCYERNDERVITKHPMGALTPTGLTFLQQPLVDNFSELRVRGRDTDRTDKNDRRRIQHVLFPLLATLLPRWNQQIDAKQLSRQQHNVKRVLVLVSGVGTPRNWSHDPLGNSTEACAQAMTAFLRRVDPTLMVVQIHSEGIFRYDQNLVFCKELFMPTIHKYRDAHARNLPYPDELEAAADDDVKDDLVRRQHPFQEHWRDTFTTTLSFADGSNARTYAIQAGLRQAGYRPVFFHVRTDQMKELVVSITFMSIRLTPHRRYPYSSGL